MRWQIVVETARDALASDSLGHVVEKRLAALGIARQIEVRTARLFLVDGDLSESDAQKLTENLLSDPVVDTASITAHESFPATTEGSPSVTVFRRPGVMDPAEAGIRRAAQSLGMKLTAAKTGTRYDIQGEGVDRAFLERVAACLSNPAIEETQINNARFPEPIVAKGQFEHRVEVPIRGADDQELIAISKQGGLSLTLLEMQTIRSHFQELGREATEIELESLAQTWSEHCKHKTLAGSVRYQGDEVPNQGSTFTTDNLLRDTIKHVTETLDRDFCLSVFHDNAGVIAFDGDDALCFKVETHNHPSAIEPYGGAGTGIGGVIRDILGTGKGARPVANTNVFCVGPPDMESERIPKGAQHPLRILKGVVSGVRDYGNQMGIPTVNGAVLFDERYVGNPLVYAGTVGVIPTDQVDKLVSPGEAIVAMGGRTGRDGIHGATFSSVELHEDSEVVDSGAVQIGNAITEKKVLDVLLQARDRNLYTAVTDCGAGGFSSAVGEMGEKCGAVVDLEQAPLKYEGLTPTEIWISEAQERMVFSVPQEKVEELLALSAKEDVEAFVLGSFTDSGHLVLRFEGQVIGDVSMSFLHDGLPRVTREATWERPKSDISSVPESQDLSADLLSLLSLPGIASKEWIIRQYDHEVQAGSAVKPLVGTRAHGPSDGAVVAPLLGKTVGFALGCGIQPRLGDLDPYAMACAVIDEALRNVVSLGGDPDHCAILDNFCWGNTNLPDRLGSLLRASYGCKDAAMALGTPFISGKDSLNNEYLVGDRSIVIPPSLLISAIARVPDVTHSVTMDLKSAGNRLYMVGLTKSEFGGSHYLMLRSLLGDTSPSFDGERALKTFRAMHQAIKAQSILSCHDCSEGGLAVTLAEMVLAGEIGARVDLAAVPTHPAHGTTLTWTELLFSESLTRFVCEVSENSAAKFEACLEGVPFACIGRTTEEAFLDIHDGKGQGLLRQSAQALEAAWRPALTKHLEEMSTEQTSG